MNSLKTKNAHTIEHLAKYFITVEIGDRINTVTQFQDVIDVARGTIQNSIKYLINEEAITLKAQGQLGTSLINKDMIKLLNFAGIHNLIGVMPLPYSKVYEGLSTGILQSMNNNLNIDVNMAYMRGAENRINMILNGRYDFAVVSKFAALEYKKHNEFIEIITEFRPGSFLSNHVLMFSDRNNSHIKDGMKIGIDNSSIDQASLTRAVCSGYDVEFIEVNYTQLIEQLLLKEIDATVWNGDEVNMKYQSITTFPLHLENDDNTISTIIIDTRRQDLVKLLNDIIDITDIEHIQDQVVQGLMIPSY